MLNTHIDSRSADIRLIEERAFEERIYRLYRFEISGQAFFIVYINDSDQSCAEMISTTENEIMSLYDMICDGGVRCEHLADIITDVKRERIC